MVSKVTMIMEGKTLGDLVNESFGDFRIRYGSAPMDTDLTNGVEIETIEDRSDVMVNIYPFFEWTDGLYKPVNYGWGSEYYLSLYKERRRQMFEFNRFDCYGNEYVCLFKDGTHHVFLVEGDERFEEFTGTYEECVGFVENTLLAARESMY